MVIDPQEKEWRLVEVTREGKRDVAKLLTEVGIDKIRMYEFVNDQLKLSLRDAAGKVTPPRRGAAPHDRPGQRRPPQRPEIHRGVLVRLAGAMLPPGTCRAAARYYAVPGPPVGLSALKTNAAAAPPSSSATM